MDKMSILSMILNIAAIVCYVVAIITFSSGGDTTLGTAFLCFGSAFMGVGVYLSRKARGGKDNKDERK